MLAKTNNKLLFYEDIDRIIDYIVLKKASTNMFITISVKELTKIMAEKYGLKYSFNGIKMLVGKKLAEFEKQGLLTLLRESPYKKYKVTSRFFEVRFGFKYRVLRSKPMFYLSPVEITYLMLKQVEGEK